MWFFWFIPISCICAAFCCRGTEESSVQDTTVWTPSPSLAAYRSSPPLNAAPRYLQQPHDSRMCCVLFLKIQQTNALRRKTNIIICTKVANVIVGGTLVAGQVSKISHSLYSFAKASFICQDAIKVFAVEAWQPLHPDLLVLSQRAVQQSRRRGTTLKGKGSWVTRQSDTVSPLWVKQLLNWIFNHHVLNGPCE